VGELTAAEAGELSGLVDGYVRVLEATEFEQRLAKLEHEPDARPGDSQNDQSHADRSHVRDQYNFGDAP